MNVELTVGPGLKRELGLLALVATAVCTVIGGGINVLSVEIQEKVPGIGGMVPLAFLLGALPAVFTALCYAVLASAMPRAGGGYIYISRALHPFLGFMATFSKWFGLATVCGVIAYMDVPLLKAAALYANQRGLADLLEMRAVRIVLPLLVVWVFWLINVVGVKTYGWTVIVLMALMLTGGACMIGVGLANSPESFVSAWAERGADVAGAVPPQPQGGLLELARATAFLFFAYIGFATISQAGGEARNPRKLLPRAFALATVVITAYYCLLSAAIYHAAPWQYVAAEASVAGKDISAPEVLGALMPPWMAVFVAVMAGLALANDIPPILLAVSRLFYAWARDGIFPQSWARINARFHTPHFALTVSAVIASLVVVECGFHGFFVGVDTTVISLLTTYLLAGFAVLLFPRQNPELYRSVAFLRGRGGQILVAVVCIVTIGALFVIQVQGDLVATAKLIGQKQAAGLAPAAAVLGSLPHSMTAIWLLAMLVGAIIFAVMWRRAVAAGRDPRAVFRTLPSEAEENEAPATAVGACRQGEGG